MNSDTGELRRVVPGTALPDGFEWLPDYLQAEAARLMAAAEVKGKKAVVPRSGASGLAQYRRDELRKKAKAKAGNRKRRKQARKLKK